MKIKSIFILIFIYIFILCTSVIACANNAKDESTAYLKQAIKNTANAQNFTYNMQLSMIGPLADCNLLLNGKAKQPLLVSGEISFICNLWIINKVFQTNIKHYSTLENNFLKQYFKIETIPNDKQINVNQWYVNDVLLTKDYIKTYTSLQEKNINTFTKNIKNIFMYDINDNTAKIYVTYKQPLFTVEDLNDLLLLLSKQNSTENIRKQQKIISKINNNEKLKTILLKPRETTYEITIDKNTQTVLQIKSDLSSCLQDIGTDLLTMFTDKNTTFNNDEFIYSNEEMFLNIAKNYLDRSKFNLNITLTNLNQTTLDDIPVEVKHSAILADTLKPIGTEDKQTNITIIDTVKNNSSN